MSLPQNSEPEAAAHRAAGAWRDMVGSVRDPLGVDAIKPPKPNASSVVFRLRGAGPGGTDVIAKESSEEHTALERIIYERVLPRFEIGAPRFYGWSPSYEPSRSWLFLEAVDGPPFDSTDRGHTELAARWLAGLHAQTADAQFDGDLPHRSATFHRDRLRKAYAAMVEVLPNPALSAADRSLLERIASHLEALDRFWAGVADAYEALPFALVHGDFVPKNLAIEQSSDSLRGFDWEEAHRGPIASDLHAVDTDTYGSALDNRGLTLTRKCLDRAHHMGVLLRTISSVFWQVGHLRYRWVERPMSRMALYEDRLAAEIAESQWAF